MLEIRKGLKPRILPVCGDSESVCREYAGFRSRSEQTQDRIDLRAEREKIKAALLPFVRETVKKQMKEEREYYRSRPSLAARQLEAVLGQGQLVPMLAGQVCEQLERQLRLERIRKGRK